MRLFHKNLIRKKLDYLTTIVYYSGDFIVEGHISEEYMINFEEELKNFKPSLEVEEVEQAIYSHESVDIMDMMQELISISRGE